MNSAATRGEPLFFGAGSGQITVEAAGDLDRLARSAARLSQRSMVLSLIEGGSAPDVLGAPLLCERLWQESGCRAVLEGLLVGRRFEFAVERAVFLTVLHA